MASSPSPASVIDVLRAVGVVAHYDSSGLALTGPDEALTPELITFVEAHRAELVEHLLEEIRFRPREPHDFEAMSAPRWPSGVARCPGCRGLMESRPAGESCSVCELRGRIERRRAG